MAISAPTQFRVGFPDDSFFATARATVESPLERRRPPFKVPLHYLMARRTVQASKTAWPAASLNGIPNDSATFRVTFPRNATVGVSSPMSLSTAESMAPTPNGDASVVTAQAGVWTTKGIFLHLQASSCCK